MREHHTAPKEHLRDVQCPLFLDVRQKAHKPGTLDRLLYHPLLLGREARFLASHDAAVRIYELFQKVDIFVVDVADVVLRKYVVHRDWFISHWHLKGNVFRVDVVFRVLDARTNAFVRIFR